MVQVSWTHDQSTQNFLISFSCCMSNFYDNCFYHMLQELGPNPHHSSTSLQIDLVYTVRTTAHPCCGFFAGMLWFLPLPLWSELHFIAHGLPLLPEFFPSCFQLGKSKSETSIIPLFLLWFRMCVPVSAYAHCVQRAILGPWSQSLDMGKRG